MSLDFEWPDAFSGPYEVSDVTDGAYVYGTNYIDLYVHIPVEGCNIGDFIWTVYVDGVYIDGGSFPLIFSSGPVDYYLHRVYIPLNSQEVTWNVSGGDTLGGVDSITFRPLIADIPIAFVKDAGVWKRALPYVKSYDISVIDGSHIPRWKQAKPFVHSPSGWSETSG
jgi:hypothetical protein